jgi:hypothetical protein
LLITVPVLVEDWQDLPTSEGNMYLEDPHFCVTGIGKGGMDWGNL